MLELTLSSWQRTVHNVNGEPSLRHTTVTTTSTEPYVWSQCHGQCLAVVNEFGGHLFQRVARWLPISPETPQATHGYVHEAPASGAVVPKPLATYDKWVFSILRAMNRQQSIMYGTSLGATNENAAPGRPCLATRPTLRMHTHRNRR